MGRSFIDWFFDQTVTEQDMDGNFENTRGYTNDFISDISERGFVAAPVLTQHDPAPDFSIDVNVPGAGGIVAYDEQGQRIDIPATLQVSFTSTEGGPVTLPSTGNEKYVTVLLGFEKFYTDPRIDGNGNNVLALAEDGYKITLIQGTEALAGTAVKPADPDDGRLILGDVLLTPSMTAIPDSAIEQERLIGYLIDQRNVIVSMTTAQRDALPAQDKFTSRLIFNISTGKFQFFNSVDWVTLGESTDTSLDTTNFDNNLSALDDTVQKAMETLDELTIVQNAGQIPVDTTNFDNNLSGTDITVQQALETLDELIAAGGVGDFFKVESFVLSALDITNGYVETQFVPIAGQHTVEVVGGSIQGKDSDANYSVAGSRFTFEAGLTPFIAAGTEVIISYATQGGGLLPVPAGNVEMNTTNFNRLLSAVDDTCQKVADQFDDHVHDDDHINVDSSLFGGNLSVNDDRLDKALSTIDGLTSLKPTAVDKRSFSGNLAGAADSFQQIAQFSLTTNQRRAYISGCMSLETRDNTPAEVAGRYEVQIEISGATAYTKTITVNPNTNQSQTTPYISFCDLSPVLTAGVNTFTFRVRDIDGATGANLPKSIEVYGADCIVMEQVDDAVPRTLTGTVTDSQANPIQGVLVESTVYNISDTTDVNGDYTLNDIPGLFNTRIDYSDADYNSEIRFVDLSQSNQDVDVTMFQRTVSGTVLSSVGGPVAGVQVFITSLSKSTVTDAAGNYSLTDIPDGSYTLEATENQHVNYSAGISVSANLTQNITLTANTVSGNIVSDTTGIAVEGAAVSILTRGDSSDASGNYTLEKVTEGAQTINASRSKFDNYSDPIVVAQGGNTKNFQMVANAFEQGAFSPAFQTHQFATDSPNTFSNNTYGNLFSLPRTMQLNGFWYQVASNTNGYNITFKLYNSGGGLITSFVHAHTSSEAITFVPITPQLLPAGQYKVTAYTNGSVADGFIVSLGAGRGFINGVLASGSVSNVTGQEGTVVINGFSGAGDANPTTVNSNQIYGVSIALKL